MTSPTLQVGQPISSLQGVQAQNVVLNPAAFYPATRRLTFPMKSRSPFAGFGTTDSTTLKQTGIISALDVRISGTLTFGGTITGTVLTWRWPYSLIKALRVSANGQANLVNANGTFLKALQMCQDRITDRGVSRSMGAVAAVTAGSLSLASDDWGTSGANQLGPGVTVAATGVYTVDFNIRVPVAFDPKTLLGAVFAQTAQTNLTCDIDYETQANIVTLGGSATLAASLTSQISGIVYTIPQVGGQFVVPDLSAFHQFVQSRNTAVAQGDNEYLLPGTGIGRQLMRVMYQTYSGAGAAAVPYTMTDANYGQQGWRYGGNDTPEVYTSGQVLRAVNEDQLGVDLGGRWGIGVQDFCADWALRDSVDEGSTSDLRILSNLAVSPTSGAFEFAQQTIFAAPVGA
jgi:hypothetical protein